MNETWAEHIENLGTTDADGIKRWNNWDTYYAYWRGYTEALIHAREFLPELEETV